MINPVTRDEVLSRIKELPAFPRVVTDVMAALDDPDASLNLLAGLIQHDPVLTGRVLALASNAAAHTRRSAVVRDVYTAVSFIGIVRVREMVLLMKVGGFVNGMKVPGCATAFWQHCVAVGVCGEELAIHADLRSSFDAALIAGLLHDIGQLWLFRFRSEAFQSVWNDLSLHAHDISTVERQRFGVDHATIGAWLTKAWKMDPGITAAVAHHHTPETHPTDKLVAITHVSEVLSDALDLTGRREARVTRISQSACELLKLVWDARVHPLFGRMEGRGRYAASYFEPL